MKKIQTAALIALLFLLNAKSLFAIETSPASITINILAPTQNSIVDSLLYVGIVVTSTYEIQYAKASVEGREQNLIYSNGGLSGTVNLNGLIRGSKTLNITVLDILNNQYSVSRQIIYDLKPVLELVNPIQNDLAQPTLRVKCNFSDDDISGSQIKIFLRQGGSDELLFSETTSFDTTLDFSSRTEGSYSIYITASDSLNQYVQVVRPFQLVKSSAMSLNYLIQYPVWDMDDSRILSGDGQNMCITYTKENRTENIKLPRDLILIREPHLIDSGFIALLEPKSAYLHDSVYEWKNGALTNLGEINSNASLVVKGKWALWNNGLTVILRNNETGELINVNSNTVNIENDVSPNGTVAYGGMDWNIYFYNGGEYRKLTSAGRNIYPRTDGYKFLYKRNTSSGDSLILNNGSSEICLGWSGNYSPDMDYSINNGWIAYAKTGNLGQQNIWLRNPQDQEIRLTPFGNSSSRIELNSDGQCVFQNQYTKYQGDFSGKIKPFTTIQNGRSIWVNNELFYVSVNAIFKVDTSLTDVASELRANKDKNFELLQNYPNPFNPSTTIQYTLNSPQFVTLNVYDILGNEVTSLVNREQHQGTYTSSFDGKNYPSGVYFARLSVGDEIRSIKMMLIK